MRPVPRLRSLLFAPAVRPDFVERLGERGADAVVIDCEDATPANAKGEGRANAARLAPVLAAAGVAVTVRVNAEPTEWFADDVREALSDALVAVVLISVGGWGLFEERAALQARIVELERSQSQASSVNAVDASTLSALEADNASLKLQLDGLYRDYELAMMEIANLQDASETAAQIAVDVPEPTSTDTEELAAAAPDAATASDADQTAGSWFVNVGAYSVAQSAANLAETLNGGGFDTVVQQVSTDEGSVLLRVRVIGLEEKSDAEQVAAELEASYGIGPVWVGQTPTTP